MLEFSSTVLPALSPYLLVHMKDVLFHGRSWMCPTSWKIYVENLNKCSAVAEMGDRLRTIDMGRKLGGCARFGQGELGPHVTQCGQGRGLPACQVSSWSVKPFGHHNTPTLQTGQIDRQWSNSIGRTILQTVTQKFTEIWWALLTFISRHFVTII